MAWPPYKVHSRRLRPTACPALPCLPACLHAVGEAVARAAASSVAGSSCSCPAVLASASVEAIQRNIATASVTGTRTVYGCLWLGVRMML